MNFPFYIARRYLLAKKSRNVINIISGISFISIMVGTAALVIVLSVFNGIDGLLKDTHKSFDPDVKILPKTGKVFTLSPDSLAQLEQMQGVEYVSKVLEENALIRYGDKEFLGLLKGVDEQFELVSGVDSMVVSGEFRLKEGGSRFAVVGNGVARHLSLNVHFVDPIEVFIPDRTAVNAQSAFNKGYLAPAGIFSVQAEYDQQYLLVPLEFMRRMLRHPHAVTALELKVHEGATKDVQARLAAFLGEGFDIQDRYQQHEVFYKVMKSEKWYVFMVLMFILLIASANIIGAIIMLLVEKEKDIGVLRSLGAKMRTIRRIFFYEGWLITLSGAFMGLALGLLVCWLQIQFGIVKMGNPGEFITDNYPVVIRSVDVLAITGVVILLGAVNSYTIVRLMTRKHLRQDLIHT